MVQSSSLLNIRVFSYLCQWLSQKCALMYDTFLNMSGYVLGSCITINHFQDTYEIYESLQIFVVLIVALVNIHGPNFFVFSFLKYTHSGNKLKKEKRVNLTVASCIFRCLVNRKLKLLLKVRAWFILLYIHSSLTWNTTILMQLHWFNHKGPDVYICIYSFTENIYFL